MAWNGYARPRTRLANVSDQESPNPVASAPECLGPTITLPHLLLDDDLEWGDPPRGEVASTFLLLAVAVLLWPLSLLILLPALGARQTGVLLGNLGYLPQWSWAALARGAPPAQWVADRMRVCLTHHTMTALYVGAVVAWAAAGGTAFPDASALPQAVVTHAMLGFQLLSSGAALLACRLSFASSVIVALELASAPRALCRGIRERDISPTYTVSRATRDVRGAAQRFVFTTTLLFAVDRRLRFRGCRGDGSGAVVVSAAAFDATRAFVQSLGLPVLPPLDTMRSLPGRALRLPSGHVILRAVAAPVWRREVVGGMLPPSRVGVHPESVVAANVDDVSTDATLLVWLQLMGAGAFTRYIAVVAACALAAGVLSAAIPWVVRAALLPSSAVAGASAAEAAAFVLLTLVDIAAGFSVVSHGGITSTAVYFFVASLVQQLWLRITPVAAAEPRDGHGARQQQRPAPQHAVGAPAAAAVAPAPGHVRVQFEPLHASALVPPLMMGQGGGGAPAPPAARARLLNDATNALRGWRRVGAGYARAAWVRASVRWRPPCPATHAFPRQPRPQGQSRWTTSTPC